MTALCLLWAAVGGAGPLAGLGLVDRQLGVLLLGTLFAVGLRRAERAHDELLAVQRQETLDQRLHRDRAAARDATPCSACSTCWSRRSSGSPRATGSTSSSEAASPRSKDACATRSRSARSCPRRSTRRSPRARSRGVDVVVLTEPTVTTSRRPSDCARRTGSRPGSTARPGAEFVGPGGHPGPDCGSARPSDERIEDRIISDSTGDVDASERRTVERPTRAPRGCASPVTSVAAPGQRVRESRWSGRHTLTIAVTCSIAQFRTAARGFGTVFSFVGDGGFILTITPVRGWSDTPGQPIGPTSRSARPGRWRSRSPLRRAAIPRRMQGQHRPTCAGYRLPIGSISGVRGVPGSVTVARIATHPGSACDDRQHQIQRVGPRREVDALLARLEVSAE